MVEELSQAQYDTVYNFLSLVIAAQLFTALFLLLSLRKVLPKYRIALIISATVCGIAAYHYFRIFDSFGDAYVTDAVGGMGTYVLAEGASFNVAYRYVDWLLTVPLLLLEAIAVLALARKTQTSLLLKLIPASALMIVLGYPGEISDDVTTKMIWGVAVHDPVHLHPVRALRRARPRPGRGPEGGVGHRTQPAAAAHRHLGRLPDRLPVPGARHRRQRRVRRPARSATPSPTSWPRPCSPWSSSGSPGSRAPTTTPTTPRINDPGTLMLIEEVDGHRPLGVSRRPRPRAPASGSGPRGPRSTEHLPGVGRGGRTPPGHGPGLARRGPLRARSCRARAHRYRSSTRTTMSSNADRKSYTAIRYARRACSAGSSPTRPPSPSCFS